MNRFRQVIKYGWQHANQISQKEFGGKKRFSLFCDIIHCYRRYGMWSNQYLKERFWELEHEQRESIGRKYQDANLKRELWVKDFYKNRKFLAKWSKYDIEASATKRVKRNKAYTQRYHMGNGCMVEYGVELSRQHHLPGTIKIGNHVLLAKNVFIDYTGEVILKDNVKLSDGVTIESHRHEFLPGSREYKAIPTRVVIEDGVWIGQKAVICEDCKCIGRFAQIGAGAVVRNQIPPYAIVVGNPAKIVGFLYTPEEVEAFEQDRYQEEEKTNVETYRKQYDKYFINRISEIKKMLNN